MHKLYVVHCSHPSETVKKALELFPRYPGDVPAGAYPSGWLPARA